MKTALLLYKQYTRHFIKEAFLMVFAYFIILMLLYAVSPLFYTMSLNQSLKATLPANTVYFTPYDRMCNVLIGFYGTEEDRAELIDTLSKEVNASGAIGVGRAFLFENIQPEYTNNVVKYIGYNDDLIKNIQIPLEEGVWLSAAPQTQHVPIIVGGSFRDQNHLQVGDVIDLNLDLYSADPYRCVIVGVLNHDDFYLDLAYGGTAPDANSVGVIYQWIYNNLVEATDALVIFPSECCKEMSDKDYSPARLLFYPDDWNRQSVGDCLQALSQYGHYASLPQLESNDYQRALYVNREHVVTAISLFIFSLLSLGGYTILNLINERRTMEIYHMCGMTKIRGAFIQIISTSLLIIIPAILALLSFPSLLETYAMLSWPAYTTFAVVIVLLLIPPSLCSLAINLHLSNMIDKE